MAKKKTLILEELKKMATHPTADEIYDIVKKRDPRISLGTVYRNLERLVEEGKINRIDTGTGPRRYDARPDNHYHIRCLMCGNVEDLTFETDPEIERMFKPSKGYKIVGHVLELQGICPTCQAREKQ